MGYFSNKEIATVAEPTQTTLANSPNFVVFSSNKKGNIGVKQWASITLRKLGSYDRNFEVKISSIDRKEEYVFKSTYDPLKVNDRTFLVVHYDYLEHGSVDPILHEKALALTTENLKECMMKNSFVKNNYDLEIELSGIVGGELSSNNKIDIISKGTGEQYRFNIEVKVIQDPIDVWRIYLRNLDIDNIAADQFKFTALQERDSIQSTATYEGSYSENHSQWFQIIKPSATVSIGDARLQTLRNIESALGREQSIRENCIIDIDEAKLMITCTKIASNSLYKLLDITDENIYIKPEYPQIEIEMLSKSSSTDTIDYGTGNYKIALDVYTDHGQSPAMVEHNLELGTYVTTLSKTYFGRPLWFDLNTLLSKKVSYSPKFLTAFEAPDAPTWCDAGTMTDYRFVAKRTDGVITESFFYSDPLYVINGYNYTLEPISLEEPKDGSAYVIDFDQNFYQQTFTKLKPLTTNFTRTHVKGQKQYINFIYNFKNEQSPSISICYKLYTQMGTPIGEVIQQQHQEGFFYQVNTALLKLDQFLPQYKEKIVGRIDVYLSRSHKNKGQGADEPEVKISTPISFRILPEVLNTVNDFAFLNQVGGWDTVNFGGDTSYEFKATPDTIYKTLQPDFSLQSEIESLSSQKIKEQKVAKASPITKEDVLWLRQLSASPAVYELSTKRYILIDDMSLKYNSSDDLYQVEMKYHYTDTFNTQVSK